MRPRADRAGNRRRVSPVGSASPPADETVDAARFLRLLAVLAVLAVAIRVAYVVLWRQNEPFDGDSQWYFGVGQTVAHGRGFLNPYVLPVETPTAGHPPLVAVLMAVLIKLGLSTHFQAMLGYAVTSGAAIVLAGWIGRRLFSTRVGIVTAVLAAVYPYAILNDTRISAESLNTTMVLLWVLVMLRLRDRPTLGNAAWVGLVAGLGALTRPELSALAIVSGLCAWAWAGGRRDLAAGLRCAGVAALVGSLTIAPWVVRNLKVMHHPVYLTIGFGWTLANTNCDTTYYGEHFGFWDAGCMGGAVTGLIFGRDESDLEVEFRERGLEYIRAHRSRLPAVVAARVGRTFGFYRPLQGIDLDAGLEGREPAMSRAALWAYYGSIPLGIAGVVLARRRRGTNWVVLLAPMAVMLPVAFIAPGQVRYRNTFDAVWLLFIGLAVAELWSSAFRGRDSSPLQR